MQKYLLLFVGLLLGSVAPLFATDYTWSGAGGTDRGWNNSSNWLPNGIPGASDNVTLQAAPTCPILDQPRTVAKLIMNAQTLDLNGFTLTVTNANSQLNSGLIKNGGFLLTNGQAAFGASTGTMLSATAMNMIMVDTYLAGTQLCYTLIGAGYGPMALNGGASSPYLTLFPTLGGAGVSFNLILFNPSDENESKTIQFTVSAQNRITALTVLDQGNSYTLPSHCYQLKNDESYMAFTASLLPTVFANCAPGTVSEDLNFVRVQVPKAPQTDPALLDALTVDDVLTSTTYFDGLERPIQQVIKQFSPGKEDVVKITEYDVYGRTPKAYLPFASDKCSGAYTTPSLAKSYQQNFYTTNGDPYIPKTTPLGGYTGTQNNAYSETVFDGSPLDRVLETAAPGDAWKVNKTNGISNGTGKTLRQVYRTNTTADNVLLWTFDHATKGATAGTAASPAYYPAYSLYVVESTDEDNNMSWTFSNKMGQTVLTRVQKDAGTVLNTYYVYDDFGQLIYEISPQATTLLAAQNMSLTSSLSAGSFTQTWLHYYEYDERKRLIVKHAPGSTSEQIVYDALDRPVLVQDGKMTGTNWLYTKYDGLNRKIMMGLYGLTSTRATLQTDYNTKGTNGQWNEGRSSATGSVQGYTNVVKPSSGISTDVVLSVNYYDDYDFDYDAAHTSDYAFVNPNMGTDNPVPSRSFGKPTGSRVQNIDFITKPFYTTAVFYDKYGRPVQAQKNNPFYLRNGGSVSTLADVSTVIYDFVGQVKKTRQVHTPGGSLAQVTVDKQYDYDHAGRLFEVYQKTSSGTPPAYDNALSNYVLLYQLLYNELGQPVEKNLHSEDFGENFLQSVDYRYNIRGWLLGINNSTLGNDGGFSNDDTDDLFGLSLGYENVVSGISNTARYSGLITYAQWKTVLMSKTEKAYKYAYDYTGQLNSATHMARNAIGNWAITNTFDERGIDYDGNGNIKTLTRTDTRGTATLLDNLVYSYTGNQLTAMTDNGDKTQGFLNPSSAAPQYTYDNSGNLITDLNRNITLTYNYLNLTTAVTASGKSIGYQYDGLGSKFLKNVIVGSTATSTWYVDGFVYEGSGSSFQLSFFSTEVGRVIKSGSTFKYEYTITDQVGNSRVSFDKGPDGKARTIQEDHYYAFGMRQNGQSYVYGALNKYLFQGSELEADQNLLNQYDYGFRQYDPTLGRWHCQDPMLQYHSPYGFVGNNPVNSYDVAGLYAPAPGGGSGGGMGGPSGGGGGGGYNVGYGAGWGGRMGGYSGYGSAYGAGGLSSAMGSYFGVAGGGGPPGGAIAPSNVTSGSQEHNLIYPKGILGTAGSSPYSSNYSEFTGHNGGPPSYIPPSSGYGNPGMPSNAFGRANGSSMPSGAMGGGGGSAGGGGSGGGFLGGVQTALDIAGLVPGIGEIADGVNAGIYALQGDYVNAGLSMAAMVPFAGWAATGGKLTQKGYKIYQAIDASGTIRYVGITSQKLSKRIAQHMKDPNKAGLIFTQIIEFGSDLTRKEARIIEQTLMNKHGLSKNGGQLLNKINSIISSDWWKFGL